MSLEDGEQYSLRWNNFHSNLSGGFSELMEDEDLVDVTLSAEGHFIKAHKMVLAVCSPYFKELFKRNPCKHPVIILKDVSYNELEDILQFIYKGEVYIQKEQLTSFLKTSKSLQVKGLTDDSKIPPCPLPTNDVSLEPCHVETPAHEQFPTVSVAFHCDGRNNSSLEYQTPHNDESMVTPSSRKRRRTEPSSANVYQSMTSNEPHSFVLNSNSSDDVKLELPNSELSESYPCNVKLEPDYFNSNDLDDQNVRLFNSVFFQEEDNSNSQRQQSSTNSSSNTAQVALNSTDPTYNRLSLDATIDISKATWRSHKKVDGRVSCQYCGATYSNKSNLGIHIQDNHMADCQLWACNHCKLMFKNRSSLRSHLRRYHQQRLVTT